MTDFEKQYLKNLKSEGKYTLEGNREYWEIIYFQSDGNWLSMGDTMENKETYRKKISDTEALNLIKIKMLNEVGIYDYDLEPSKITMEKVMELIKKQKIIQNRHH